MLRQSKRIEVTVLSGESASNVLSVGMFAGGIVHFPAAVNGDAILFLVSATGESGYTALQKDGALLTAEAGADLAVVLPNEIFSAVSLKLQFATGTTPENQASDRTFYVTFKS